MKIIQYSIVCFIFISALVHADEPPQPYHSYNIVDPSHHYTASISPYKPKLGVTVKSISNNRILWTTDQYFSWALLANDGNHLISGYDGMNLIPHEYSKDMVLLTFWNRDKKIRDVTLRELVPDLNILIKTISHYYWGNIIGLKNKTLIIERCDKHMLYYNIDTGYPVNGNR